MACLLASGCAIIAMMPGYFSYFLLEFRFKISFQYIEVIIVGNFFLALQKTYIPFIFNID